MNDEIWVVIVYDKGDKINSWVFDAGSEALARERASVWIDSNHGEGADWSLHKVNDRRG